MMQRPPLGLCLPCRIVRVIDGDTVEVVLPGSMRFLKIRLLDCWAPELNTQEGKRAREFMVGLVGTEQTHLFIPAPEDTKDLIGDMLTFGRVLGHVFLSDSVTLSEKMVESGNATKTKQ